MVSLMRDWQKEREFNLNSSMSNVNSLKNRVYFLSEFLLNGIDLAIDHSINEVVEVLNNDSRVNETSYGNWNL